MRRHLLIGASLASLGVACVQPIIAQQPITARVQLSVQQPRLTSVPDIPSVAGARVDVDTIHASLDHLGQWVEDPQYGVVWMPGEQALGGQPFVPYGTGGQWQLTDAGWYWQSSYSWGWLTFHYGRWVAVRESWAWVPGAMFAPAWVDWRVGNGWVGWVALPPRGAPFSAPYAYCSYGSMTGAGLWGRVVYGPAAATLYATTHSLPPANGVNGAAYSWGPSPNVLVGPSGSGMAVPVNTAWSNETHPRSGAPGSGGEATPVAGHPVGTPGTTTASARVQPMNLEHWPVEPVHAQPQQSDSPISHEVGAIPTVGSVPRMASPMASGTDPVREMSAPRGISGSSPRLQQTVSLGTTEGTAETSPFRTGVSTTYAAGATRPTNAYAPVVMPAGGWGRSGGYNPPMATSGGGYPSPVSAPSYAPPVAGPSYAQPASSYPQHSYAQPSYAQPSYQPHAYAPSYAAPQAGPSYAQPSYSPPVHYSPPMATGYSAPVSAPVSAPSYHPPMAGPAYVPRVGPSVMPFRR